jgi:alanyl-tRNA synthetase
MTALPIPDAAPPTERLYWSHPQARSFTATVTAIRGQAVALDRTVFYPEGGGQACDAGTLNWTGDTASWRGQRPWGRFAAQVTDVQKAGDTIWHTLEDAAPEQTLPEVGTTVTGELNWTVRYRHSQRHTAEHLLAQAFWRVNPAFGVRAVSMRGPECTIDLAGQPGPSHVAAAQELLTERLREGLTLDTRTVPDSELNAYPLRRPPQAFGLVRLVLFRGTEGNIWEASACGGTHLPLAVQAAPLVVLKTERVKGDLTRVTFMAGEEAQGRLSGVYAQAQALAQGFSVGIERLPERVADLQSELRRAEAKLAQVRRELALHLLGGANWRAVPDGQVALIETEDDLLAPLLQVAGERAAGVTVVLTFSGRCGVASSLPTFPAQMLLRGWLAEAGGRGGGRPELAQGQTEQPEAFRRIVMDWSNALTLPQ